MKGMPLRDSQESVQAVLWRESMAIGKRKVALLHSRTGPGPPDAPGPSILQVVTSATKCKRPHRIGLTRPS
jgi:hypothetical protein